jgi:epsilon-lactone hydrolase
LGTRIIRYRAAGWFYNALVKLSFRLFKLLLYSNHYSPWKYRKGMDFFAAFFPSPRKTNHIHERIGQMKALWVQPARYDRDSVILYLHGGGFGMGSIRSHRRLAAHIARACHSQCLLIEYRLAPEFPFPGALDDAVTAYEWLLNQGFAAPKIVLAGDSAGGGLVVSALCKLREISAPLPLAAVCLSPWLDLEASSPEMTTLEKGDPLLDIQSIRIWGKRYAGMHTANPLASPIHASLAGLPPILVQVGTSELLLFENRKFYEKALTDGVSIKYEEYPDMVHVFQVFAGFLPQATMAVRSIGRFVLTCSKHHSKKIQTVVAD